MNSESDIIALNCDFAVLPVPPFVLFLNCFAPVEAAIVSGVACESYNVEDREIIAQAECRLSLEVEYYL